MQSRRESAVIVFADLSMLMITVLISGYFFLQIKEDEILLPPPGDKVAYLKELELPVLDKNGSLVSENSVAMSEVDIFREGGGFAIDGRKVDRSELGAFMSRVKTSSLKVNIDGKAFGEDILFLQNILNSLKIKSNYTHQ
jgi:hypothetical protein